MKKILHYAIGLLGNATIVPRFFGEKELVDSFRHITKGVMK